MIIFCHMTMTYRMTTDRYFIYEDWYTSIYLVEEQFGAYVMNIE